MSFTQPTVQEINDAIITQLQLAFNQSIPLLPKSFNRVLAKVLAGVFVICYKYIGFVFLQMFIRTASAKPVTVNGVTVTPLIEWGRQIGVGDPLLATNAELTIEITVTNQTGSLPAYTQLTNTNNGVIYITTSAILLDAATKAVNIIAVNDQSGNNGAGAVGNLAVSDTVRFINPLANVAQDATVTAVATVGADGEEMEAYRARVLQRFQKRPQGGAYADYEQWGETVAGVLNVYPYTGAPGIVDIYVECTPALDPDGIPDAGLLSAVEDAINLDEDGRATRRNVNAFPNVMAITRIGFDVEVTGLVVDDEPTVQASIEAALDEFFRGREPFIDGLSILPKTNRITAPAVISIVEEIVSLNNGVFDTAEFFETGLAVPLVTYTLGNGEKAKVVTVTFTP